MPALVPKEGQNAKFVRAAHILHTFVVLKDTGGKNKSKRSIGKDGVIFSFLFLNFFLL